MELRAWLLALACVGSGVRLPASAASTGTAAAPALEGFLLKASAQYAAGNFAEARKAAESAIALNPNDPRAYVSKGRSELRLKAYAEAEADASKALGLGYRKASIYNVRSEARAALGRFADGLLDAENAIRAYPKGGAGFVSRAVAKTGIHANPQEILADYRRAAELDHRFAALYEAERRRLALKSSRTASSPSPPRFNPLPPLGGEGRVRRGAPRAVQHLAPTSAPAAVPRRTAAPSPPEKPSAPAAAFVPPVPPGSRRMRVWGRTVLLVLVVIVAVVWVSRYRMHRLRQVRFGSIMSPYRPPRELLVGSVVGKQYIIGKLLERRPQVEIYDARDLSDETRRVKRLLLPASAAEREGLREAAQKSVALRHPNLERLEVVFEEGGYVCLGTRTPSGESLERAREKVSMKGLKPPSPAEFFQYLRTACEGLQTAHRQGLVHGHLSPRSIWVGPGGTVIADFGLPLDEWERRYQAPEGAPSVEGDLYALAACFFESMLGRLPQQPQEARTGAPAGGGQAPPNGLGAFFVRAFDRDPAKRFKSASELVGTYRALVPGAT